MKQGLKQQVKALMIGCLVRVEWYDASVGKSLTQGTSNIDVPVNSWGIYLGVLGEKNKHIILAQNTFRYADGLYDVDYTAVPLVWTSALINVNPNEFPPDEAKSLLTSFLAGRSRTLKRRVSNHERHH